MGYALKTPKGKLLEETFSLDKHSCEGEAFYFMSTKLGPAWEKRFWKRWAPAQADIRLRGYRIVKVRLSQSEPQDSSSTKEK